MASINRSATRKAPAGVPRPKKTFADVQQGIKELYPCDKKDIIPDIDIVFVPGLGADPEKSWQSSGGFNWTSSEDGIIRDFPRARVLLYMHESAWTGPLKVKNFISNLGTTLLNGLHSKREDCPRRPIVFIGHSMGGLIIAKAIVIADSRRDIFPQMFEAIAGCLFFGTPFGGAPVSAIAAMFANVGERIDQTTSSKLLDMMKPGDESLNELRNDFMRLAGKTTPRIELYCFWEVQPTDYAKMAGLPALSGLFKIAVPKSLAEFVSRESATLVGVDSMGLESNHRDLVKFDSFKDTRYQLVRSPLKRLVHGAGLVVKGRMQATRNIDRTMVNSVMEVLDGAQVSKKRKAISQKFTTESWIPKEQEYVAWLSPPTKEEGLEDIKCHDCLWIRGPEGRGKTSGMVGALDEIEKMIRHDEEVNSGQAPILLAYFFCDDSADYSTAEDLLKSLVRQLISQQESLAVYAKHFAKDKAKKSQAQLTVENLWQTLQDMLTDEFIGSRLYFAINNLHVLPDDSDSTLKFLKLLGSSVQSTNDEHKPPLVRWMITSRKVHAIEEALKGSGVRLIDLDDDKYENQVQLMLRRQAHQKVALLSSEKKYNKALSYFASSLIGRRAQNSQWIDITCVKLQQLEPTENELRVRRLLESIPLDLKTLLDSAWMQVFKTNCDDVEKIKEILRALILTYEDPSEDELQVLASLGDSDDDKAETRRLIESCKPLLCIKRTGKNDSKVGFLSVFVKTHLLENSKRLLGLDEEETKWQHGVMAYRSFSHIMQHLSFPKEPESESSSNVGDPETHDEDHEAVPDGENDENEEEEGVATEPQEGEVEPQDTNAASTRAASVAADEDEPGEDKKDDEDPDGDDSDDDEAPDNVEVGWGSVTDSSDDSSVEFVREDPEADLIRAKTLPYIVKHWIHHASKATLEIAEDLSLEKDFWERKSIIRWRWLLEYNRLTSHLEGFDLKTLTALHIAAAVGFRHLVAALLKNGHADELNERDSLTNTPLHFASYIGRPNTVEELLSQGASVDDGIEISKQTPLCMASLAGNVQVMRKLLRRGANANAVADDPGPVLNAAIYSGNQEAVRLLVEHGVSLSFDHDELYSPLQLAALLSDITMFEYLTESYADKLPPQEYDKALISAATAGRVEVFKKLLRYEHTSETFQNALTEAADDENWDIVLALLETHRGPLQCDTVFHQASRSMEQQDKVLDAIWEYTGGAISQETLDNSLYDATDREKPSTVELCLRFGANPNATGEEYGNALTAAAYDGTLDIVKMILDGDGDVNAPEGWALHTAAEEGHYTVVEELLARGAKINAVSEYQLGRTALQTAVEASKAKIVALLLEHEADPNLGGGPETCPIIAAARKGEAEIFEMLIKAKARVDVFGGPDMSTPLTNAAAFLPLSSMQLLLDAGADINLPDNDEDTALIVASRRGDSESVQFLLDNGADLMFTRSDGENALKAALENEHQECMKLLVDRVSVILTALKTAVDEGNSAVSNIIRSVAVGGKLNYGDAQGGEGHLSYDDPVTVQEKHDEDKVPDEVEVREDTSVQEVSAVEDVVEPFDIKENTTVSMEAALNNPLAFFDSFSPPFQPATVEFEAPVQTASPLAPSQQPWEQREHMPVRPPSIPGIVRKPVRPLSRYNGKFSPNASPAPSDTSASQYQPPATQEPTPPPAVYGRRANTYPLTATYEQQPPLSPQLAIQAEPQSPPSHYKAPYPDRYQSPQPYPYNDGATPPYSPPQQQSYQPFQPQQALRPDQPSQLHGEPQPSFQPQSAYAVQQQTQTYAQPDTTQPPVQYQYNPANTHQAYRPQPAQSNAGDYPTGYGAPQQPYYEANQRNNSQVSYDGEGWGG